MRHAMVRRIAAQFGSVTDDRFRYEIWWTRSGEDTRTRLWHEIGMDTTTPTVIISLGGDGTHNHILHTLIEHNSRALVLLLPMGSGNDGASVSSLEEALSLLEYQLSPQWVPAVKVTTTAATHFAFNIASIGMDAYITYLHDKLRRVLPGNTYRFLVDLASLAYEAVLHVQPLGVTLRDERGVIEELGSYQRSLVAFGATGKRTYGDHMWVLPGNENVCVIDRATIWEKMQFKKLFFAGRHPELPLVTMRNAHSMELSYSGSLPLQFDGETLWMHPEDFPITMERVAQAIRVLRPANIASLSESAAS